MNSRKWITTAAVAAAVILGSSLANWNEEHTPPAPAAQPQSGVVVEEHSHPPAEEPTANSSGYWMRNWQGRLGVFVGENEEPELVYDVYIKNLPEADRTLLAEGLYVAEYADLVSRIEDYIS